MTDSKKAQGPQAGAAEFQAALDKDPRVSKKEPTIEELKAEIARLKELAAAKPARTPRNPDEKRPAGPSRTEKREQENAAIVRAFTQYQKDHSLQAFVDALYEAKVLNHGEAVTLVAQSGLEGEPASQKQVAEILGHNTWAVYNYRRDALKRIAEALEVDWESLHETFGLRRGTPLGTRVGRYLPKAEPKEKKAKK